MVTAERCSSKGEKVRQHPPKRPLCLAAAQLPCTALLKVYAAARPLGTFLSQAPCDSGRCLCSNSKCAATEVQLGTARGLGGAFGTRSSGR